MHDGCKRGSQQLKSWMVTEVASSRNIVGKRECWDTDVVRSGMKQCKRRFPYHECTTCPSTGVSAKVLAMARRQEALEMVSLIRPNVTESRSSLRVNIQQVRTPEAQRNERIGLASPPVRSGVKHSSTCREERDSGISPDNFTSRCRSSSKFKCLSR